MQKDGRNKTALLDALECLYRDVDRSAQELGAIHADHLRCRCGCRDCCVDGLTVFALEADNIKRRHGDLLAHAQPHPAGACAFLDAAGACRIYRHRPYVCRTQGLPLRWIEQLEDGDFVELRDICPLNDTGEALETLPEAACWTIGPAEGRLAALQAALDGGKMRRIALRALFCPQPEPAG